MNGLEIHWKYRFLSPDIVDVVEYFILSVYSYVDEISKNFILVSDDWTGAGYGKWKRDSVARIDTANRFNLPDVEFCDQFGVNKSN